MKTRTRKIALYAVALAFAALFVRLGFWQLDRRAQRVATERAIEARAGLPPLDWTAADSAPGAVPTDTAGIVWRRVRLTGRYDRAREVVLRGRVVGGAPGVELLTPLRTAGRAVLVLRGFLPAADALRPRLAEGWPAGTPDSAAVTVTGTLIPSRSGRAGNPIELELDGSPHLVIAGADADLIASRVPYPVAPFVVRAEDDGLDAPALGAPREIQRGYGPHLSYAIQWFSFAAIALIGTAVLVRREG